MENEALSSTMGILIRQVEAMNLQLYNAEKQILNLRKMDISMARLIFLLVMIMMFEAAIVTFLAWRVCEWGK